MCFLILHVSFIFDCLVYFFHYSVLRVRFYNKINMASTELRGHEIKVYKPQVHLDIRKYFFSVRTVDALNSLPAAFFRCNYV